MDPEKVQWTDTKLMISALILLFVEQCCKKIVCFGFSCYTEHAYPTEYAHLLGTITRYTPHCYDVLCAGI